MKLNLGCGKDVLYGYDNYDINPIDKRVRYIDLEERLPFKDNYANEIRLLSVLEHINNRLQLIKECERVLCGNGRLLVRVPFFRCHEVGGDITHKLGFTLDAFRRLSSVGSNLKVIQEQIILFPIFRWIPKRIAYLLSLYSIPFNMVYQIGITLKKSEARKE